MLPFALTCMAIDACPKTSRIPDASNTRPSWGLVANLLFEERPDRLGLWAPFRYPVQH